MPIELNDKFACFAYDFYGLSKDMPDEVQLAPGLWAFRRFDLDVAKHWKEWMGSIKLDALKDAAFVMLATRPSSKPEILDQEHQDLVRTLDYLLFGILLQGVPDSRQGFSLTGANVKGEVTIRGFSDLRDYQPTFDMPPFR